MKVTLLMIVVSLASVAVEAGERVTDIDIFTDSLHPIVVGVVTPSLHIRYYDLDAAPRFEAELSTGLPSDPLAAERAARERLRTLGVTEFAARLATAFRGALLAHRYALVKYPAVVFDEEAVVYGVRDLSAALLRYERWRAERARR